MTKNTRMPVEILGTVIGSASGWDDVDVLVMIYYDFEPVEGFMGIGSQWSITVDYGSGVIDIYDEDGAHQQQYILGMRPFD